MPSMQFHILDAIVAEYIFVKASNQEITSEVWVDWIIAYWDVITRPTIVAIHQTVWQGSGNNAMLSVR